MSTATAVVVMLNEASTSGVATVCVSSDSQGDCEKGRAGSGASNRSSIWRSLRSPGRRRTGVDPMTVVVVVRPLLRLSDAALTEVTSAPKPSILRWGQSGRVRQADVLPKPPAQEDATEVQESSAVGACARDGAAHARLEQVAPRRGRGHRGPDAGGRHVEVAPDALGEVQEERRGVAAEARDERGPREGEACHGTKVEG